MLVWSFLIVRLYVGLTSTTLNEIPLYSIDSYIILVCLYQWQDLPCDITEIQATLESIKSVSICIFIIMFVEIGEYFDYIVRKEMSWVNLLWLYYNENIK